MEKKNIVVYGAGQLFLKLKEDIVKKYNIEYICDKKFSEEEKVFEGIPIISSEEVYKLQEVYICINDYSVAYEVKKAFEKEGVTAYMLEEKLTGIIRLSAQDIKECYPNGYRDENNNIIKWENVLPKNFSVKIYGKNNCLNIGASNEFRGVTFTLGNNAEIKTGHNVAINSTWDIVATDGKISIGDYCIFGANVTLRTCNGHHIFSALDMERICKPRDIKIGNHVWLGKEVMLFGGADIGDGSVLGARTVTSGTIGKNVLAAGIPAKVLREDILWSRDGEVAHNRARFMDCIEQNGLDYI